ncbi:hypothetical protein ALC57_05314 [Trachymyrmex cornetzi]|uniref:Uncharacterized protein n=1 Tax=Trachymyrmex cornetzi TaxID=471704 RepID=A0A151JB77_9HYME|nr:hypothetical protein ALC57_05314 [Trachymyrmex cornetzi]
MHATSNLMLRDINQRLQKLENGCTGHALNSVGNNDDLIAQFLPVGTVEGIKQFNSLLKNTEEAVTNLISKDQFIFWAHEITNIWHEEDIERWYISSKRGKSALGKLYYYYTNKLRKIKAAVTEFNREETEHIEKQIEEEADVYISELNNTSLDDKKKILSLWEKTFVYRTKANGKNIAEYFDGYPQLRPPLGIQLIELDFKLLNIAQINTLEKKWPVLHPNIIRLAKKQPIASNLLKDFKKVADVQAWLVLPIFIQTG